MWWEWLKTDIEAPTLRQVVRTALGAKRAFILNAHIGAELSSAPNGDSVWKGDDMYLEFETVATPKELALIKVEIVKARLLA